MGASLWIAWALIGIIGGFMVGKPESHTCDMRKHMWRSAWWIPVSYIVRHRQHQYRSTVAGGVGSGVCAVPVGAHHRLAKAQLR